MKIHNFPPSHTHPYVPSHVCVTPERDLHSSQRNTSVQSYWLVIFCTTNNSWVLTRERLGKLSWILEKNTIFNEHPVLKALRKNVQNNSNIKQQQQEASLVFKRALLNVPIRPYFNHIRLGEKKSCWKEKSFRYIDCRIGRRNVQRTDPPANFFLLRMYLLAHLSSSQLFLAANVSLLAHLSSSQLFFAANVSRLAWAKRKKERRRERRRRRREREREREKIWARAYYS